MQQLNIIKMYESEVTICVLVIFDFLFTSYKPIKTFGLIERKCRYNYLQELNEKIYLCSAWES